MRSGENLDMLAAAYEKLVKAGTDSLSAAYTFGQIVDALAGLYTLKALGAAIGHSAAMVSTYRRLYRAYPSEHALQHAAAELGTYDISRLCGNTPAVPVRYVYRCENCGSYDTVKEREGFKPSQPPALRALS
ncbi:MAG TPA: hypothetical protein VGG75_37975 [Trebonia sp.]|jgi:hypothetical protein